MPSRSGEEPGGRGRRDRGAGRIGCLLGLLAVAALGYVTVVVVESEFRYRSVREAVQQELRTSEVRSVHEIRRDIVKRVEELDLPPAARQVTVRPLPGDGAAVSLSYADTLEFLGRFTWIRPRRVSVRHGG